jgi:hypothetical protein
VMMVGSSPMLSLKTMQIKFHNKRGRRISSWWQLWQVVTSLNYRRKKKVWNIIIRRFVGSWIVSSHNNT